MAKRPDWILAALDKNTEEKGNVGVGWSNSDGSISIRLEPFVVLTGSKLVINLFPKEVEPDA